VAVGLAVLTLTLRREHTRASGLTLIGIFAVAYVLVTSLS
jgi:hypothetical protein